MPREIDALDKLTNKENIDAKANSEGATSHDVNGVETIPIKAENTGPIENTNSFFNIVFRDSNLSVLAVFFV